MSRGTVIGSPIFHRFGIEGMDGQSSNKCR